MTLKELLKIAGFNDVEYGRLVSLSYRFPKVRQYAEDFMSGNRSWESFDTAIKSTDSHACREASAWALDMLLCCHCFVLLYDDYQKRGYSDIVYAETANDLVCKVRECVAVYGDIGTVSVTWYWGFFVMERFAFGRLQFGSSIHGRDFFKRFGLDGYERNGYSIEPDMTVLDCHIPSSGPLPQELCFDSYRRAREHFKYLWDDGIMRASCGTHLFYPKYREIFGNNTRLFADNFDIVNITETEGFGNSWRFLDTCMIDDLDALPAETSAQRRLIEYMKQGGTHGNATGFMIFDGEKILNK